MAFYILLVFAVWAFLEKKDASAPAAAQAEKAPAQKMMRPVAAPSPRFSCDGRQHCSQMRSRAEAEFFVRYCPNTKMDGDNDGEPCENDSRF